MTLAVIVILVVVLVAISVVAAVVFLIRHRGLDDSTQTEAYPQEWEAPTTPPPPAEPGATSWSDETEPPSGPPQPS